MVGSTTIIYNQQSFKANPRVVTDNSGANAANLISLAYADATFAGLASNNALSGDNTFSGATNTFNNNPLFPAGAVVDYVATVTNVDGSWEWLPTTAPLTANVQTTNVTATPLISIAVPSNSVVSVEGIVNGSSADFTDATGGTFSCTVINTAGVLSLVGDPFVIVNAVSAGLFNVAISGSNLVVNVVGLASTTYNWNAEYNPIINQ